MYAQLCKRLSEEAPNFEPPDRPCTFRLLLLNKCRAEFENRASAFEAYNNGQKLSPEDEEKRHLAKCKMLGNIKFIGELGKLEILAESILHRCIQQLLASRQTAEQSEDLECLAQLVRTVGRILDSAKGRGLVDQYFVRMDTLSKNRELPSRIRFMLRDVTELRRDGWVPRRATSSEGPVPIQQLRGDEDSGYRGRHHQQQEQPQADPLFRHMKTRGALVDDMLSNLSLSSPSTNLVPPPSMDKYHFSPNGFGGSRGEGRDYGRHRGGGGGGGGGGMYNNYQRGQQQGYNKHHQNNNNSGNAKEVAPRFNKNRILPSPGAMEDLQMRPAANSLLFKANNLKPQTTPLPLSNPNSGLRPLSSNTSVGLSLSQSEQKSVFPPIPSLIREPAITIKPASDKANKPKKDKGPNKEEILKQLTDILKLMTSTIGEDIHKNGQEENSVSVKDTESKTELPNEIQDAIQSYKELKVPDKFLRDVAFTILKFALDKKEVQMAACVRVLCEVRSSAVVGGASGATVGCVEAVRALAAAHDDTLTALAALVAQLLQQGLCNLTEIAVISDNGNHHPLFLLILQHVNKTLGKKKLLEIFNKSKVNLMSLLPSGDRNKDRLAEILEERSLSFLCPLLRIQSELTKQMAADSNPTQFYKWIKQNVEVEVRADPAFVNALVTVLMKYITQESTLPPGIPTTTLPDKSLVEKEKELIEKYSKLLIAFLQGNSQLQLVAIYSLQVYTHSLGFPKGMLLRWFVALYDLEICDEETFLVWREDVTDAYPGKGDALFQVNAWLTWLQQQESDDEDAED